MKYTVLILCINPYIRIEFQNYLTNLLGNYIRFDAADPADITGSDQLKPYHCVLFSSKQLQEQFSVPIPPSVHSLYCTRTFNHTYLDQIIRIPPGESVLIVNDTLESAMDIASQLTEAGISQYHFIPFAGNSIPPKDPVRYAITIGEPHLVPSSVRNVINIGNRIIDISTIHELCALFRLPAELSNQITHRYLSHIFKIARTAGTYYSNLVYSRLLLSATASSLPVSLCLLDRQGGILLANSLFTTDWGIPNGQAQGKNFAQLLPKQIRKLSFHHTADYRLLNRKGMPLILSVQELSLNNYDPVYLLSSRPVLPEDSGPFEYDYTMNSGDGESDLSNAAAQNSFLSIITGSDSWNRAISYARRLSLYDFPILIQGESGTQKKMLAGAIHRNSRRRAHPFVSLNQMLFLSDRTLPQILEQARHGTLLVDNVERLSLEMQDFLIQALQSSNDSLGFSSQPYDVRIIATSSADLYQRTQDGSFRQELFFLLNAATIETVPLKQRREDIPLLFNHFFKNIFQDPTFRLTDMLSTSLYNFLLDYDYPGNVQELMNLAQYLSAQYSAHPLILSQLPSYIKAGIPREETKQSPVKAAILGILKDSPRLGRASILEQLEARGFHMTEGRLRGSLKELSAEGLILVHRTKGGCEITEAGLALISDGRFSS